jgi:hypothetical protein
MQMRWRVLAMFVGLGLACAVRAAPVQFCEHIGDVFEIGRDVEATEKGTDGSNSSSTDRDTLSERVVGASQAGLELEYDLPKGTSEDNRARQWQLPARVLRPPSGPLQLLNRSELAARAATWLNRAGLTDAACGHWYFTWNAFQIECDPQSVVETIAGFELGPDNLVAGALYQDPQALSPAPLSARDGPPGSTILYGEMAIDPEAVRRGRAQTDVVVGEIMRKPVTFETALRAHSAEDISGTIAVTFDIDAQGHVRRQTKVITLNIKETSGRLKTRTVTQTLERRLVSRPPRGND